MSSQPRTTGCKVTDSALWNSEPVTLNAKSQQKFECNLSKAPIKSRTCIIVLQVLVEVSPQNMNQLRYYKFRTWTLAKLSTSLAAMSSGEFGGLRVQGQRLGEADLLPGVSPSAFQAESISSLASRTSQTNSVSHICARFPNLHAVLPFLAPGCWGTAPAAVFVGP